MEEQKKNRKRKTILKTKGPELVRSVKVNTSATITTTANATAALSRFEGLWK